MPNLDPIVAATTALPTKAGQAPRARTPFGPAGFGVRVVARVPTRVFEATRQAKRGWGHALHPVRLKGGKQLVETTRLRCQRLRRVSGKEGPAPNLTVDGR
ncbi:MAG: hypothetical protein ABSF45_24595 [Terriglobia bacterium]